VFRKGQIIEIPSSSAIYASDKITFRYKKEELLYEVSRRNYGLFDGFLVGEHEGVSHFKHGQRKGINVGGKKEPLYVIGISEENNQLFVGAGEHHPGLWTRVIDFKKDQIREDSDFLRDPSETGREVFINSAILDHKIPALLYIFEDHVFLEFESPVSIALREYPVEIHFTDPSVLTITIIK
jgi:tRNA U34 2-thiouridine synthase MnmA/TrmU